MNLNTISFLALVGKANKKKIKLKKNPKKISNYAIEND
jgi:hypothetical protein